MKTTTRVMLAALLCTAAVACSKKVREEAPVDTGPSTGTVAPTAPTAPTAESLTASPRAANPAANPPRKGLTGYGATHALQPRGKVRKMAAALEGAPPCRVPGPEPCQQTLP